MSHPARGPIGTMGIDGKANGAIRRQQAVSNEVGRKEAAGDMSHSARGPIGTMGIDGTAHGASRRQPPVSNEVGRKEAAENA